MFDDFMMEEEKKLAEMVLGREAVVFVGGAAEWTKRGSLTRVKIF